jgi:hypothetical protein
VRHLELSMGNRQLLIGSGYNPGWVSVMFYRNSSAQPVWNDAVIGPGAALGLFVMDVVAENGSAIQQQRRYLRRWFDHHFL